MASTTFATHVTCLKQYAVILEAVYAPYLPIMPDIFAQILLGDRRQKAHIEGPWNEGTRQQGLAGKPPSAEDPWELGYLLV
jgi:hypothetical protein